MTHALQVLYTLQWHHPGGRALLQLAQAPTQDYHSYTHALLGGVQDKVVGPNDPPVKKTREHSAAEQLWPNKDVTTRFPASEAGSDPRGHLWVTWGVYLCAGKPPLADIILSHPPDLT